VIYLLDTNTISDLPEGHPIVGTALRRYIQEGHTIGLCPPVRYEIERGLLWRNLVKKLNVFRSVIRPQLTHIEMVDTDSTQATQFWISSRSRGRQLSDMDVIIAAIAHRLDAVIVSSDTDFDALPVKRDNWRDFPQA
jgi:predicted nucleic acid-binding protein